MRQKDLSRHHSLAEYLIRSGIQPGSFAYFLSQYIKKNPSKTKSVLSHLLSEQLKAQAQLIVYSLKH